MKKISILIALIALVALPMRAQQTNYNSAASTQFNDAMQLYEAGLYGAARTAFDNFANDWNGSEQSVLTTESKYYRGLSAKNLRNADAVEVMKAFLTECSQSARRDDMLYHLGDYYLIGGDEARALTWFTKANPDRCSEEYREELIFKTGYCYFMRGKHNKALAMFDRLKGQSSRYDSAMRYYRAHVDYENGNLNVALKAFMQLEKEPGFQDVAPYYIAHIFYLQGHYPEAIRYAEPLSKSTSKRAIDMQRIVADSHFMLQEYDKATPAYERLMKLSRRPYRADYYHYGMSLYYTSHYTEAADNLSKVTSEKDQLAQNAYYHLADCYLRQGDKKRARTAFDAASKYDFDRALKEDAHFNKLKLAYELNFAPFDEIISQFVEFIDTYPNSDKIDEAYDYMGKAFVTTKNYKKALATMEKIQHKNLKIYTAMQRIAFYRGLELYTDLKFTEAIDFFDYSLEYGNYDSRLKARAYYWKGESLYRQGQIEPAREHYRIFINAYQASECEEFTTAHYNLGYTYFNERNYDEASRWFIKYVSLNVTDKRLLADAYNRLGDCLYVRRNFAPAIENYDKALATSTAVGDYSMLQKGICLGFTQGNRAKINQLQELIKTYPNSSYCDNAYYETARAHVALEEIKEAIYNFKVVKERYPKGSLASKAMLQLGLLYYNNNEFDNSMAFYKRVVNEYPSTPEAAEALAGLRNVYMELGDFDGYMAYTSTRGSFAKVELHEQDSLLFTSAQRLYMKGDINGAKPAFERYLSTFPDGRFAIGANFYLADCLYQQQEFDDAVRYFNFVAEQPRSIYTEDALLRSGEILYKNERYPEALTAFQRLENEAEIKTNKTEAIIGQMRCMQRLGDAQACIDASDKVIDMPEATPEILREAKYLKAKSLITLGRSRDAVPELQELSLNTKSVEGAEAKYLLAQGLYDIEDLAGSEKEIFDYIDQGTPHQYWLARSFVLLADIYHARGEDFQAQQYLETLRDSYDADDDIDDMIDQRIDQWRIGSSSLPDDEEPVIALPDSIS